MLDCPRTSASWFSKMFFIWLYPLFFLGWKKDLNYEDLYSTLNEDSAKLLGTKLINEWEKEVKANQVVNVQSIPNDESKRLYESEKNSKRPSLLLVLIRQFWARWAVIGIFLFLEECVAKIAQPLLLAYLLRYFNQEYDDIWYGYMFASGLVLSVMYYTISHHPSFFSIVHLNMKIRVACSALLYSKTLKLNQSALSKTTVGQIVNLLSNDVARFDFSLNFLHYLWIGPVQLLISVWILWKYFGPSCLSGVIFLLLFTPFQSAMGHLFSQLRLKVAKKTDKRVRIMNEIISGVRVIKIYGWEIPFSKLVEESREDEIKSIGNQMTLRAINLATYYVSSKLIIFLTLCSYVWTGNYLTAEKVFVAMALYQNVRLLMTIFFPWGISFLAETKVSIKRLEDFLLNEEYIPVSQKKVDSGNNDESINLTLKEVCAKWNEKSAELTLNKIDLTCFEGKLIAIIGPVGSGKSSLLQAILNELPLSSGDIQVNGSIGYVPQESFIFSGTVRENILFNKPYSAAFYQKVVESCALRSDFSKMPFGDKTNVGDKGLSLSGGQKARINLARAVYAKKAIYLLDDPLSAIDSEVGRHVFEKCICGILKNKIRVLVTHQLHFLEQAQEILVMSNGSVVARGTYEEISKHANLTQILEKGNSPVKENENQGNESTSRRRFSSVGSISTSSTRNRKESVISTESELKDGAEEETTISGSVGIRTFWLYLKIGSNVCLLGFIFASNLVTQALYSGSDFWLRYWISQEVNDNLQFHNESLQLNNESSLHEDHLFNVTNITNNNDTIFNYEDSAVFSRSQLVSIYTIFIVALFIMTLVRTIGFFKICMRSSITLHLKLFYGVLRAKMIFFESNNVGRILNRFTRDISTIDELLPFTLFDTLEVGLQVLGVIAVVSIINPIFLIPSAIIAILFYFIRKFFQRTARNLKRLEGTARSPVFSHLSTTLNGLTTIRAFNVQDEFQSTFESHLDLHTSVFYLFNASARWLGIVVDWISILYISCVTFGVVKLGLDVTAAGLAISSAMSLTSWFQWGVRQSAEAENQMVSVERVLEYIAIEPEAPLESFPERKPPPNWPTNGEIEFQGLFVKYGNEETPFLKDITCVIRPLEKIGICGRSGAGKSSLINSLFRLTEPSKGALLIDGINVLHIGLGDLRTKISNIPQDPVLFSGTIRYNLDPFNRFVDQELWDSLEQVQLKEAISIDFQVADGGSNLSVGQRQLVCLARAILQKNKIIVLDEATAAVDPDTDVLIQKTIREKFINCTILTVAHRLNTIIDSDRILLLDSGKIKEFDEPHKLLSNPSSAFSHLVNEMGTNASQELRKIAKERADLKYGKQGDSSDQ